MGSLRSLGEGFLAALGLIWSFNIVSLFRNGDSSLAMLYLMIITIALSSLLYLKVKSRPLQSNVAGGLEKWRGLLFSCQGVALGFWAFDLATTFYAINVTGLAYELNPLGWPLGILGALTYYGPTVVFAYVLLFKFKERISIYAAVPLSMLTLVMGTMNLLAATQNFQVFVDTATLQTGVFYGLLAVVSTVCLMLPLVARKTVTQPKPVLTQ